MTTNCKVIFADKSHPRSKNSSAVVKDSIKAWAITQYCMRMSEESESLGLCFDLITLDYLLMITAMFK